jgi:hypothetical protein
VSPSRPLQLGSVVWAELEDANGYRKVRPVAVVGGKTGTQLGETCCGPVCGPSTAWLAF